MPTSKGLSPENKRKLNKVYAICNAAQKKNGMTDQKKEKCLLGVAKRFNIHKEMKDDLRVKIEKIKMCKCK